MKSEEFSQFEQFLLCDNKEEFLSKLIPGTELHNYLSLLYNINSHIQNKKPLVELSKKLDAYLKDEASDKKKSLNDKQKSLKLRFLLN